MTENKYYTPSIEELHIGFEYEMRTEDTEGNTVYEKNTIHEGFGNVMRELIRIRCIRVKYLDHDDIKELGWRYGADGFIGGNPHNYDAQKFDKIITFRGSECLSSLLFNQSSGWCCIVVDFSHSNLTLFAGKLKNKSELKRIMKMIGI